jgi:UDP-N-acetylmuramoyl-tripeptide--D-alanyl-D-alanine ligase
VRIRRRREGTEAAVRLPLLGEAAAVDLTAALAAAEAVAGPIDDGALAVALRAHRFRRFEVGGRMQVRRLADGTLVLDDTYNANPQSVRAALRTLAEVAGGRRAVCILGEMKELGPTGPAEHAALGAAIAAAGVTLAVSCGGLADLAIDAAAKAGIEVARAPDAGAAARLAVERVEAGDVVLVKASRSVGAERVVAAVAEARGGEIVPSGPVSIPPSRPSLGSR